MKLRKLLATGLLVFASVAAMAAEHSLPNPHDDTCWSSLAALRACQIEAQEQAQAYAQNCTSYPEYQCFDYYRPPQKASMSATQSAKRRHAPEAEDGTEKGVRP